MYMCVPARINTGDRNPVYVYRSCNTYCNTLQHTYYTATHYNTLHPTATLCNTLNTRLLNMSFVRATRTATHWNTLQHTVTHCNTLQHTATHCNTLQHTATYCSTMQHTATHCNTLQHTATHCNTLQHTAHVYLHPVIDKTY